MDDFGDSTSNIPTVDVNDLISISWKSDAEVIQCLENRFLSEKFYTWAGIALIAMNPYFNIQHLYTDELKDLYSDIKSIRKQSELPPHVYTVAARAQYKLDHGIGQPNQVIVISGDSGSGKTYTAWHVLNFLATLSHDSKLIKISSDTVWKICYSTPLLSAFGNAQTMCNDNSSRFGKLLQLQHKNGNIVGAYFETYLLEKTRIAFQHENERNFHIFHQLLAGLDAEDWGELYLSPTATYKIVPGPKTEKDRNSFSETKNALFALGITATTKQHVFQILACILHLGNLIFVKSQTCDTYELDVYTTESRHSFESACKLLGLEGVIFAQLLTTTMIATQGGKNRRTVYHKLAATLEDCHCRRDSFMRFLYERLFKWIVGHINSQVAADNANSLLGILDIYGFEAFKNNSLEQLCINYANERLQQFFTKDFLVQQRDLLLVEDNDIQMACNAQSTERIGLLDGPYSVFSILNEESVLQRYSSDSTISNRFATSLKDNKYLVMPRCTDITEFIIKHFAGDVHYNVNQMLEKNSDRVPQEFVDILKTSNNKFVIKLIQTEQTTGIRKNTLLTKFKNSVDTLCKKLDKADVHYIRCIKTNGQFLPKTVDTTFLQQQLKASGILEIIPLSQQFLPIRLKYEEFELRYKLYGRVTVKGCKKKTLREKVSTGTDGKYPIIQKILETLMLGKQVRFGRQSVFLTESAMLGLEEWRNEQRINACVIIQRTWRRYQKNKNTYAVRKQKYVRSWLSESHFPITVNEGEIQPNRSYPTRPKNSMNSQCGMANRVERPRTTPDVHIESYGSGDAGDIKKTDKSPKVNIFHIIYLGDGIISKRALSKVPIRFHTRPTCLKNSHYLPACEFPQGLSDALW